MTTLEQRYRRLIRILPNGYRTDRAEEILSTLLDGARPEQRRPAAREIASLLSLAVRLRFGAPGAGPAGRLTGEVTRLAIIANLLLISAMDLHTVIEFDYYQPFQDVMLFSFRAAGTAGETVLFLTLLLGWIRTARGVALVLLAYSISWTVLAVHTDSQSSLSFSNWIVWTAAADGILISLTVLAVFPAFHREAPRLSGRRWWLLAWATLTGFVVFLNNETTVFYAFVGVAVVVIALTRTTPSPAYPIAFMVAGWPLLVASAENLAFPWPDLPGTSIIVAVTATGEAILLVAGIMSIRRRRRLAA